MNKKRSKWRKKNERRFFSGRGFIWCRGKFSSAVQPRLSPPADQVQREGSEINLANFPLCAMKLIPFVFASLLLISFSWFIFVPNRKQTTFLKLNFEAATKQEEKKQKERTGRSALRRDVKFTILIVFHVSCLQPEKFYWSDYTSFVFRSSRKSAIDKTII